MSKYSMGIDFGTQSARAVIADVSDGREISSSVMEYSHGVMSGTLFDSVPLENGCALQHPGDYLECLAYITKDSIEKSGVAPEDIIGVGVDFTSSTILPVTQDGTPLCFLEEFKNNPDAYVKLWKHNSSQKEADEITELLKIKNPALLESYGGRISAEWLFPKVLQILRRNENVYNNTFRFIEAGDWIVWMLTGNENHSVCHAGFKALYSSDSGYPDNDFFKSLDPKMNNIIGTKIFAKVSKMSETAGYVTAEASALTNLPEGTAVAPAFIDAHAALPALGITKPGELLMILGTSSCHILLGENGAQICGIAGCVKDGIVDGLYAYEAGQSCVGDSFEWFVKNCTPKAYYEEAQSRGVNIYKYLQSKASQLLPGSGGVVALDWWNGCRTPYDDGGLSGSLFGLTLSTMPEQIYRALIESTAYGTKRIVELYEKNGIEIKKIYATGGIAEKDELFMQIYADVLGKEIFLSDTAQGCALGSAVLGSVAGKAYPSLSDASKVMKKIKDFSYKPKSENTKVYTELYEEYKNLCEYFAKESNVMKKLKKLK